MRALLGAYEGVKHLLVEPEYCLGILAADIREENAQKGARPLEFAGSETVEHWEGHYLSLVAASLDGLAKAQRSAGPVNMYGIRARALKSLKPFMDGSFPLDGRSGLEYRAEMESLGEEYSEFLRSERQYHGE